LDFFIEPQKKSLLSNTLLTGSVVVFLFLSKSSQEAERRIFFSHDTSIFKFDFPSSPPQKISLLEASTSMIQLNINSKSSAITSTPQNPKKIK
jgi:hypothetical protein